MLKEAFCKYYVELFPPCSTLHWAVEGSVKSVRSKVKSFHWVRRQEDILLILNVLLVRHRSRKSRSSPT